MDFTSATIPDIRAALLFNQLELAARREVWEHFSKGMAFHEILKVWKEREELKTLSEKFNPDKEIEACLSKKIEMIVLGDAAYSASLASISDPPFVLYAQGNIDLLKDPALAVVGSRQASFYGLDQARRFSRFLADSGLTIVSGLALGIDQAAHEAALDTEGHTLAVLGCGIDIVYPRENKKLFERMMQKGLILSEYPLGAEPRAYHFPRRNRILSGLSLGVLVIEAHERSGSLITAYQALEQGREVFAVPGPVQQMTSRGTHRLIREGASLVESPEEILSLLTEHSGMLEFQSQEKAKVNGMTSSAAENPAFFKKVEGESHPLLELLQHQNADYENLFELSKMSPQEFAHALTELEIEGKVRKNAAGYYEIP